MEWRPKNSRAQGGQGVNPWGKDQHLEQQEERGVPTLSEHGGQGLPGLVWSLELPILGNKKTLKKDCEFEVSFRSAGVSRPDTVKNGERKGERKRTGERERKGGAESMGWQVQSKDR